MENIATKTDGSILTPEEFNQIPEELENAILSSGQILSENDMHQLAKTIVAYAGAGASYDVGGTANNLVLTPHNNFIPPIKYYQNMIINFIPKLTNTDTVNISIYGLTSVSLTDSNNQALRANKLIVGIPYSAYFNGTNFQLIELGASVDGSNITNDFSINIFRSKISNVILSYKNNGIVYSNSIFTVKNGFQVLIPNGKTEDSNLNSIEVYVLQDSNYNAPTSDGTYYLFMQSDKSIIWSNSYTESFTAPAIDTSKIEVYYNINQNVMYYHYINSSSWSERLLVYLGTFNIPNNSISLRSPIRLDNFSNVNLTCNQTISGQKIFNSSPQIPNVTSGDSSTNSANTKFVTTAINTVLSSLYPVGSIYIGTQSTCPLATLISGSQWQLVAQDRALWGGNGSNANTTIAAGLPNISGKTKAAYGINNSTASSGALSTAKYTGGSASGKQDGGDGSDGEPIQSSNISFNASNSNSIYGASSTVQPPAYRVNIWRRTA